MCNNCDKRKSCKKICAEVEKRYLKFGHSIKSNYIVKFFPQYVMETVLLDSSFTNYKSVIDETNYYKIINEALIVLTDKQRLCITLYYGLHDGIGNYSQPKTAKELHISQHSVYRHLKNAKRRLKKFLKFNI